MKVILSFIIFSLSISAYCQKTYTNKALGITITLSDSWYKTSFKENDSLTNAQAIALIDKNSGYAIADFGKRISWDKDAVHSRIVIDAYLNKQAGDFKLFKETIVWSVENNMKPQHKNFSYVKKTTEITISGIKSIYTVFQYDFEMPDGTIAKVKNRMYVIPYKKYFFRIMCIDGQDERYDSSKDFEAIIAAIKIV